MNRSFVPASALILLVATSLVCAQSPAIRTAYVDADGVMRWHETGKEVALFGVNYYTPFSWDYSEIKRRGLDHKKCIDQDVAHFVRMGLNAIRLHVFDREISDKKGNLIENHKVELLDYLIYACKQRGIYTVLTPIAWWGGTAPKSGFSSLYSKPEMVMKPEARKAQTNYLRQFMNHRNPYTKLRYKEDPAIVAIELINEVTYSREIKHEHVVRYIRELAQAVRSTGAKQPIFYNGWQGHEAAVRDAGIEGCTFGWYPTGLASGHSLYSNFLPRLDDYPRMRHPALARKAKIVYEFDAADVPGSYMYPAMARAFRGGGAQIATQFQYDPLALASRNSNWHTHYLNLVYAPAKSVSFIIAAEAFRRLPRLKTYGTYPKNTRFGPFRVSFEEDLSEMATDAAFMYSNDTKTMPPAPLKLERIVGCGSSPLVSYDGTGAYFLDRLSPGLWRLEVYPDAVWVSDPYMRSSAGGETSRLIWRERIMRLHLPDLGNAFAVRQKDRSDGVDLNATDGTFRVRPGVYVLRRAGCNAPLPVAFASSFVVPQPKALPTAVRHDPPTRWLEGTPLTLSAVVATERDPDEVLLHYRTEAAGDFTSMPMTRRGPYRYDVALDGAVLKPGSIDYWLSVGVAGHTTAFPLGESLKPGTDYPSAPRQLVIFDVKPTDEPPALKPGGKKHGFSAAIVPGSKPGAYALRLSASGFGKPIGAVGCRRPLRDVPGRRGGYDDLIVRARSLARWTTAVEIGLIEKSGAAFGYPVRLAPSWQDIRIPLKDLRPLWGTKKRKVDILALSELSIVFGAWLYGHHSSEPHAFEIERVMLAQQPRLWTVSIVGRREPVPLFSARRVKLRAPGHIRARELLVPGMRPGRQALRVEVNKFGPPPSCVSFRSALEAQPEMWRGVLRHATALHLRARAGEAQSTAVEVVLIEQDGTPWGTVFRLTPEWQELSLPLSKLRHFKHWRTGPKHRGGPDDHFRPENVQAVNVCFGAWLYKGHEDEPHAIEIEEIALARAPHAK